MNTAKILPAAALLLCLADASADARFAYQVPQDFVLSHKTRSYGGETTVYFPVGQTAAAPREMAAATIMPRTAAGGIDSLYRRTTQAWKTLCPAGAAGEADAEPDDGGCREKTWAMTCAGNTRGNPDFVMMRAFEDKTKLYAVQYAYWHEPSDDEIGKAVFYLNAAACTAARGSKPVRPSETLRRKSR